MVAMAEEQGKVLAYRSPRTHEEWTARIGMSIFLGSWAMMFAALFFTYGGVRTRADVWPPLEYPELPLGLPSLNTLVVACSSALLVLAIRALRAGRTRLVAPAILGAAALGVVFLLSQIAVWRAMSAAGLTQSSSTYGSVFFGLTWVHAAHVLVGLVALFVVGIRSLFGAYTPARHLTIRLWAMYWHFVGIVWAVLFVTVYVL
jgi:cytochrome c oxidase subunit III